MSLVAFIKTVLPASMRCGVGRLHRRSLCGRVCWCIVESLTPSSCWIVLYPLFVHCIVGVGRLGCILVRLCCLRRRLHGRLDHLPLHSRGARLQCCITKALATSLERWVHQQIFCCIVEYCNNTSNQSQYLSVAVVEVVFIVIQLCHWVFLVAKAFTVSPQHSMDDVDCRSLHS